MRRSFGFRLESGGLIDRSRKISFSFNGKTLYGHPGDTLASALIANGVNLIGRSFKYHRPRGLYGVGTEDPNSMLAVRDAYGYEPALRAGQVRLCEGLEVHSVTGYPTPEFDIAAGLQLVSRVISAGFYYKTFKWPTWALFEPWIQRSTGFGRPKVTEEDRSVRHRHAVCDVLIVGGGPAGLATARHLVGSGLRVILADDQPQLGGSLNWEESIIEGRSGADWSKALGAELAASLEMTVLNSTFVTAAYEGNHFTLLQSFANDRGVRAELHWKLHARWVVIATGAIDRPLLFPNNDRPGIMLSAAVRRLIREFGVTPATRLAIYTNNDSGYLTAMAAVRAGVDVAVILDTRAREAVRQSDDVRDSGIECLFGARIVRTSGYRRIKSVTVQIGEGRRRVVTCDGLAVTGGFTPLVHLVCHRGIKPVFDSNLGTFVIRGVPPGWRVAGGVNGISDLRTALREGRDAAYWVCEAAGLPAPAVRTDDVAEGMVYRGESPRWEIEPKVSSSVWVDFQNDVKASDVLLAAQENYISVEHLKRYTTLGMGTDQGRTSNVNGLALLAAATGRPVDAVGTTTLRPPYTAVRMGTIANRRQGPLYKPMRLLPAHSVHERQGAVFEDFGWQRPDWYRCNGPDREAAIFAEMTAVRTHVGVFDGSSLGKVEVTGLDAAEFLSRFYVSNIRTLQAGRIRYSVMLKEDGVIYDDGVVARLAENHYLASPSSGNADSVVVWLERWRQTEWPSMRVGISAVTSGWASIAIAGPQSRELLARLEPNFDISNDAFPHMQIREGEILGVKARIARVSFTGECQYEVSVPARYGASLVEFLLMAGKDLTPRAVGLEAWLRLRLEKGYLHVGSDTNGRTTPLDIGLKNLVLKREDDFIGKRSLSLAFAESYEREQLVGVIARTGILEVGGRILAPGKTAPPCETQGYVTSACVSPTVGKSIGLALIERGFSREGESVSIYCGGKIVRGTITSPVFYDRDNKRLNS